MTVHAHSREAYATLDLPEKQRAVVLVMALQPPLTDRQIAQRLGWEVAVTRPRISELVEAGVARECGSIKDPTTGRTVRLVQLA